LKAQQSCLEELEDGLKKGLQEGLYGLAVYTVFYSLYNPF
jgi:hypothetical protein